jgi:hypothetical protein
MTDSIPIVFLTKDDLWEVYCGFACERMVLERGFVRAGHSDEESNLPSFRFNDSRAIEDSPYYDYRFQRRVLALNSALWDYINATIHTCNGTVLQSGDFFHCLRVVLDRVTSSSTPTSEFFTLMQSHRFIQTVARHRHVVFRLV